PCTRAGASTPSPLIPSNAPSAIASTAEAMVAVSSVERSPSTADSSGDRRPAVQNSEKDVSDSGETSNGASRGPKNAGAAGDQPKPGAPASCRRANRRPKSTAAAASGPVSSSRRSRRKSSPWSTTSTTGTAAGSASHRRPAASAAKNPSGA